MASKTEVVNLALSRIGITRRVANIETDSSKEAVVARGIYSMALDELLRLFPWPFATTAVALAETVEAVSIPGWEYQYQYPTGCLQGLTVCTADGVRDQLTAWTTDYETVRLLPSRYPFRIALHPSGDRRVVLTDLEDAYLIYTARVEDTLVWDALFTSTFAWKLSAELAPALLEGAAGSRMRQDAYNAFSASMLSAAAQSFNEAREDERPDSQSIIVRG